MIGTGQLVGAGSPVAAGATNGFAALSGVGAVVLIAAGLVWVIGRQVVGTAVTPRRLLLVPAGLLVWGAVLVVRQLSATGMGWADGLWLAGGLVAAVGLGAARGASMRVSERGGWRGPAAVR